jgi:transposase
MNNANEAIDNSFVIYETWEKGLLELGDDKQELKFRRAINAYGLWGTYPDFKGLEKAYFDDIKNGIDRAKERHKQAIENGKKGGRPATDNETKSKILKDLKDGFHKKEIAERNNVSERTIYNLQKCKNPNDNDNVNENENLNDNDNVNKKDDDNDSNIKSSSFSIPTLKEVQEFALKNKLTVDPFRFWHYYAERQWENVSNWKSAILHWNEKPQYTKKSVNYNESESIPSV